MAVDIKGYLAEAKAVLDGGSYGAFRQALATFKQCTGSAAGVTPGDLHTLAGSLVGVFRVPVVDAGTPPSADGPRRARLLRDFAAFVPEPHRRAFDTHVAAAIAARRGGGGGGGGDGGGGGGGGSGGSSSGSGGGGGGLKRAREG